MNIRARVQATVLAAAAWSLLIPLAVLKGML